MADDPKTLVSTDWLAQHLKDPDLRILDASWYLPDAGRDPKAEYDAAHIPGARFFDIDGISDARSDLPHMAPPIEKFMSRLRAMGVGDGHQVVVYDGAGLMSAARVWWLFRLMGQENVAVLDGGLPKWQAEGRETEDMPPVPRGIGNACESDENDQDAVQFFGKEDRALKDETTYHIGNRIGGHQQNTSGEHHRLKPADRVVDCAQRAG